VRDESEKTNLGRKLFGQLRNSYGNLLLDSSQSKFQSNFLNCNKEQSLSNVTLISTYRIFTHCHVSRPGRLIIDSEAFEISVFCEFAEQVTFIENAYYTLSYIMYYMPTITVRISEEEKKKLLQHGDLSKSVREAVRLYLNAERSRQLLTRLEELQRKNPVKTTTSKEVRMINEDRTR
jgi:hypothetical protein